MCLHVVHYAWAGWEMGVELTQITLFDELVLVADGSRWLCSSHDTRSTRRFLSLLERHAPSDELLR